MTIDKLITYLRGSVFSQDPDIAGNDTDFLNMKDEDLINILQICITKVSPEDDLEDMLEENVYPLILTSKIELYHRLAVKSAPNYKLVSSSGAELNKDQIFEHYYKLIQLTQDEYKTFMDTGGSGLNTGAGDILLDTRYFSKRNYDHYLVPKIKLLIDNIYKDKVELSWKILRVVKYKSVTIYLGTSPIIDKYDNNKVSTEAKKMLEVKDLHINTARISNLQLDTTYYIALVIEERNGLKGVAELSFTTLGEEPIEEPQIETPTTDSEVTD